MYTRHLATSWKNHGEGDSASVIAAYQGFLDRSMLDQANNSIEEAPIPVKTKTKAMQPLYLSEQKLMV